MIPTNYLRWVRSKQAAHEERPATLQQWWSAQSNRGEVAPPTKPNAHMYGEWRDVPIEGEQ